MESDSTKKFYYLNNSQISNSSFVNPSSSNSFVKNSFYINTLSEANPQENFNLKSINVVSGQIAYMDSVIDKVSQWFLSKSSMTNKKLQKLCYYTYCWFIVFFNDVEAISEKNTNDIKINETKYALLPVFVLNIKYNDKIYHFAMNGESGKLVGEIPVDKKKLIICIFITFILSILLVLGIFLLLGYRW